MLQEFRLYLERMPAGEGQQAVNVRWLRFAGKIIAESATTAASVGMP